MIHKQGPIRHGSKFQLPYGSNLLKAEYQPSPGGVPELQFWYAFDLHESTTHSDVTVEFAVVGTGWEFDLTGWSYLDTVFENVFVWHILMRGA